MPMFYTPKPRQFTYKPRFYDPEKERWEALKQKYADERLRKEMLEEGTVSRQEEGVASIGTAGTVDADLEYFQRRVREIDSEERSRKRSLTWKDLFRKREMPKFNYQPRFSGTMEDRIDDGGQKGIGEHIAEFKKRGVKIKRRFDVTDTEYMKPIPAGRIMLYALLVCLLLYWVLF